MTIPQRSPPEADAARANLVRALTAAGLLPDARWRAAFADVPRHAFLDRCFLAAPGGRWRAAGATDDGWLDLVYADRVLVVQLDDDPGRWAAARANGPVDGIPTSSSSQPAIMAVMLAALRVRDGDRVLEIGTGTGYNAALLCHRLGAGLVTTVDVDAGLVADAADRLARLGHAPTCAVADGADGFPANAPYDRVLATCSVAAIPQAWLAQTVPGGLVVTTLHRPLGAGLLRIVAGDGPRGHGRVLAEDGRFMPLRAHRRPAGPRPAFDQRGEPRRTALAATELTAAHGSFEFYAGLALPGVSAGGDPDGGSWLTHPDGSWARHATRHGRHRVWQGGPRALWDRIEAAHAEWAELGRPDRTRFGITVEPDRQELWLDDPDAPHRWPLPG